VVHRDLKASNVMRGSRAIETDTSDAGGGVHGTVGYIAPGVLPRGEEGDVYAFVDVEVEVLILFYPMVTWN
jgi:hypothetical protein